MLNTIVPVKYLKVIFQLAIMRDLHLGNLLEKLYSIDIKKELKSFIGKHKLSAAYLLSSITDVTSTYAAIKYTERYILQRMPDITKEMLKLNISLCEQEPVTRYFLYHLGPENGLLAAFVTEDLLFPAAFYMFAKNFPDAPEDVKMDVWHSLLVALSAGRVVGTISNLLVTHEVYLPTYLAGLTFFLGYVGAALYFNHRRNKKSQDSSESAEQMHEEISPLE